MATGKHRADDAPRRRLRLAAAGLAAAGALLLGGCVSSAPPLGGARPPLAAGLACAPQSGVAPLTVTFDAAATSGGYLPLRYDYDFDGDGVFEAPDLGPAATHVYSQPGSYRPRLKVTDARGAASSAAAPAGGLVTVTSPASAPPTASLTASALAGNSPLLVQFDAGGSSAGSGALVRYDYDFNADGIWDAYDSGPQVAWTFASHGQYTVRLRVTDEQGGQDTAELSVAVNAAPVAALAATPDGAAPGGTITFSAAASSDADGTVVRYEWDADGNGTFETDGGADPQLQVLFPVAGEFSVGVRVTDDAGAHATASLEVSIAI
jgi:PKD repeat protein